MHDQGKRFPVIEFFAKVDIEAGQELLSKHPANRFAAHILFCTLFTSPTDGSLGVFRYDYGRESVAHILFCILFTSPTDSRFGGL